MQDELGNLFPIGAVRLGIEQAQIGDEVLFVISGQNGFIRRDIGNMRVEWR